MTRSLRSTPLLLSIVIVGACGDGLEHSTTNSQDELRTKCALPFDDAYEQNDSQLAATNLDDLGWTDFGPFRRVSVRNAVAIGADRDWYKLELTKWSTVRASFSTSGPLHASLSSVHPEMGWQDGFDHPVNGPGSSSASGGRMLPPGTWYLLVVRERVCQATRYDFSVIVGEDNDNDGVPRAADNCPTVANHDQADHDSDGFGDACDAYNTPCATTGGRSCQGTLNFGGDRRLNYWRNFPLNRTNPQITHAVIVVHGDSNGAKDLFNAIAGPAANNGRLNNTLIVAPYFKDDQESNAAAHPPNHLVWGTDGWKYGDLSLPAFATPVMSSFDVMDQLIAIKIVLSGRFPNLTDITVTGHSAGAQFTNRYAAGGLAEAMIPASIHMSYGVANAGYFTYLTDRRKQDGVWATQGAWPYDAYPYGYSQNLNSYMLASNSLGGLVNQFISRDVWFLIGEREQNCTCVGQSASARGTCSPVLPAPLDACVEGRCSSVRCTSEALLQGDDRFERVANYVEHLALEFNYTAEIRVIPGVDHHAANTYGCGGGPALLFGPWAQPNSNCP